jgi:propionyl-CoA synthetase
MKTKNNASRAFKGVETMSETSRYAEVYGAWRQDGEAFWREAAEALDWIRPPSVIFEAAGGPYGRWFPDGLCNTSANCLDRHVAAGRGGQAALIHESPVTGKTARLTYAELLREVELLGATLSDFGIRKGDRVLIYLPMIPEAVIAMLASARIGAIHSVVFGGFAAHELAKRIAINTKGQGTATMEFGHYAEVPRNIQEKIIASRS